VNPVYHGFRLAFFMEAKRDELSKTEQTWSWSTPGPG